MKKTVKLICLALALLMLVFSFTACGGSKNIVVGITEYEPMNYYDAEGNLIGFDTDLAKKVFENMGYKVIFKVIEWDYKYADLEAGTIDCIWNGFTCNTADDDGVMRAEKVDFSYNYMENRQAVVIKNTSAITSAADLKGKIGVAESGSAGQSYASSFEGVTLKEGVTKQTDCLLEVNAGTADFAVVDAQLAKSYCGKGDYSVLTTVAALESDVEYYAIGFKKGSPLVAKVNAELEKLGADGTMKALGEQYGVENSVVTNFEDQKSVQK